MQRGEALLRKVRHFQPLQTGLHTRRDLLLPPILWQARETACNKTRARDRCAVCLPHRYYIIAMSLYQVPKRKFIRHITLPGARKSTLQIFVHLIGSAIFQTSDRPKRSFLFQRLRDKPL